MIDLTPEDLMDEINAITDELNKHHLKLAKEKLKATELVEIKHELLDTAEKIYFVLKRLRTGIQMAPGAWSGLDPV